MCHIATKRTTQAVPIAYPSHPFFYPLLSLQTLSFEDGAPLPERILGADLCLATFIQTSRTIETRAWRRRLYKGCVELSCTKAQEVLTRERWSSQAQGRGPHFLVGLLPRIRTHHPTKCSRLALISLSSWWAIPRLPCDNPYLEPFDVCVRSSRGGGSGADEDLSPNC